MNAHLSSGTFPDAKLLNPPNLKIPLFRDRKSRDFTTLSAPKFIKVVKKAAIIEIMCFHFFYLSMTPFIIHQYTQFWRSEPSFFFNILRKGTQETLNLDSKNMLSCINSLIEFISWCLCGATTPFSSSLPASRPCSSQVFTVRSGCGFCEIA